MNLCPAVDLSPEAGKVRDVGPTLMGLGPEAAKLMDYIQATRIIKWGKGSNKLWI
jgi:hypothetical protein